MLADIVVSLIVFGSLFASIELLQRLTHINKHVTRKLAHIAAAGGAAFLPLFMPLKTVAIIGLIFVCVMFVSKKRHIFMAIHDIPRQTSGEIYMPLGIALSALLAGSTTAFVYACLVLASADVSAEYFGKKYGRKFTNKHIATKSIQGSAAFFVTAYLLGLVLMGRAGVANSILVSAIVASCSTVAELVSLKGLDNLSIPLTVIIVLRLFGM